MFFVVFLAFVVVILIVGGFVARYCRNVESEMLPRPTQASYDERQLRANVIQLIASNNL